MVDLGDGDVELRADRVRERLHDVTLLLQRSAAGDPQIEPLEGDEHLFRLQLAGDLADLVRLDDVTFLQVVEVLDPDAALEALRDLSNVVLEAAERPDPAVVRDDAVANDPGATVPHDRATGDVAPGDHAHLRNPEQRPDLRGT